MFLLKNTCRSELKTIEFYVHSHLHVCCLKELAAKCKQPWQVADAPCIFTSQVQHSNTIQKKVTSICFPDYELCML